VNAEVRPVLLILTLPITLVTLGLFLLVLNGLCFWLRASPRTRIVQGALSPGLPPRAHRQRREGDHDRPHQRQRQSHRDHKTEIASTCNRPGGAGCGPRTRVFWGASSKQNT